MASVKKRPFLVGNFLFFIFFYLYIWLRIDPRLLYYRNPELFLLDIDFFKGFLAYPGGLADYLSKFLHEFYYFPWAGALIITLLSFLTCLNFSWFLKRLIDRNIKTPFLIPAFLILIIYNQYSPISLVGLLLAFIFANIYISISPKNNLFRIASFLVLSVLMYYFALYSYWLFAALTAVWEIIKNKKYILGYSYLGIQIFLSYITAIYILYVRGINIVYFIFPIFFPGNFALKLSLLILFIFIFFLFLGKAKSKEAIFILPVLVLAFFQLWAEPVSKKILYSFFLLAPIILVSFHSTEKNILKLSIRKWNKVLLSSLTILSLTVLLLTFNKGTNSFLKINYFSQNKMWEGALKETKIISPELYKKNQSLYQMVFKTLYHTGYLPYEQFNYPNSLLLNMPINLKPGAELLHYINLAEMGETLFSLGLINHSELMTCWELEVANTPLAIKRLALIYIVKGNNGAARVILNRIKKSLLYKKWAEEYLMFLEDDSLLAKDKYLSQVKSRMIASDDVRDDELLIRMSFEFDYEGIFKRLLTENKNNKMAFEYLMAYYLLIGQTEKVLENLVRLDDFGYTDIPHNYQEAILINMLKTGDMDPNLQGREINQSLLQNYRYFNQLYRRYNYNKIATYNALKEKHSNSYFLYYIMLDTSKKR